ncbi:efflux RND transporter periplasmic adaptor subunit [bacterium]|nr:efflux RND transporter periplasmic adaptor subunit [bacterium]
MSKNKIYIVGVIGALILVSVGIVFFLTTDKSTTMIQGSEEETVLYYTCGMHPSVNVSPDEYEKGSVNCPICNMKLVPVYKEEKTEKGDTKRKVLFYRNPMNPEITSSVPTKDEMGMDYVPVYEEVNADDSYYGCGMEGEEHVFSMKGVAGMKCPICGMPLKKLTKREADSLRGVASRVKIKGEQIKLAGAITIPVRKLHLSKTIRTVGRVAYDPKLAVAEDEYISALRAYDGIKGGSIEEIKRRSGMLVDSSEKKLKLLGLSDDQIIKLRKTRMVHTNLILPEKTMWIYGDVYQYELGWLKPNQKVEVKDPSMPGEIFEGVIISINPVFDSKTRSVIFRAEVDNRELKLKPDMYVDVIIRSTLAGPDGEDLILAIPKNAVLDTGTRKLVWFDKGNGLYEGREIIVGPEATVTENGATSQYFPVMRGAREGELVVTKANFLIDSQSQLSGVASSAYGGALGSEAKSDDKVDEEKKTVPVHQH